MANRTHLESNNSDALWWLILKGIINLIINVSYKPFASFTQREIMNLQQRPKFSILGILGNFLHYIPMRKCHQVILILWQKAIIVKREHADKTESKFEDINHYLLNTYSENCVTPLVERKRVETPHQKGDRRPPTHHVVKVLFLLQKSHGNSLWIWQWIQS